MQIYLARNQQQAGPYTLEQLNQMLASQQVLLTDLIWHAGMSEWKTVGEVTQGQLSYTPKTPQNASTVLTHTHQTTQQNGATFAKVSTTTLAPISKRAFAKAIDLGLWIPASLFPTAFMNAEQHAALAKIQAQGIIPTVETQTALFNLIPQSGWIAMAIYILLMLIVQALLLRKTGQSIGKKVMVIQIVDEQSKQLVQIGRSFFLRSLIFIVFNLMFMPLSTLIDWAFAIGKKRQTLHDRIAKTIVIDKK